MSISTVIITRNEEENIVQCIESVESFSEEIIILDSFSTDKTKELCLRINKVKFYERAFDNYIQQKNFANSLAKTDYIFSLDADEYVSKELSDFLKSKDYLFVDAMEFKRINLFANTPIEYGLWRRDRKIRLWKKKLGVWAGSIPHEHLELNIDASILKVDYIIYHKAYISYSQLMEKSYKYAKLASLRYNSKSGIVLLLNLFINPIFKFLKGYIFLQGFRDGIFGWYIAKMSLIETWLKYYWALKRKMSSDNERE